MKTAIVTGANRGLGLASAQKLMNEGYTVIFACRDPKKIPASVQFKNQSCAMELDTSKTQSIEKFANDVLAKFNKIDVLINNAGVFLDDKDGGETSALKTTPETMLKTLQTNTIGPALLIQKILPSMIKNNFGRIVNISSGMGQLSEMGGAYLSYRTSKTALNAITRIFANEVQTKNILINSVCPGHVRTDMGGASAPRTLDQGIYGIIWAATLPDDGPTGGFFRDGKPLDW